VTGARHCAATRLLTSVCFPRPRQVRLCTVAVSFSIIRTLCINA
jgi:hypothetical protein